MTEITPDDMDAVQRLTWLADQGKKHRRGKKSALKLYGPGYFFDNKEPVAASKSETKKPLKIVPKKAGDSLRLDLGCGARRPEPAAQWGDNWIGIDISSDVGADYVFDLRRYPWPLADESVDEIYTSHFLEHLSGHERIPFMDECFRVLKAGSKMTVIVPYWSSMRSIQDPFHAWPPICEMSFLYFNKGWREKEKLDHYPIKCDFDFGYGYNPNPELISRNDEYRMAAVKDHVNSVWDLIVTLTRRDGAL